MPASPRSEFTLTANTAGVVSLDLTGHGLTADALDQFSTDVQRILADQRSRGIRTITGGAVKHDKLELWVSGDDDAWPEVVCEVLTEQLQAQRGDVPTTIILVME